MKKIFAWLLFLVSFGFSASTMTITVDTDNGTSYCYTALATAETAIDCDLTVSTTIVIGHSGITGTIKDGSQVFGATSGAGGICLHATATQMLINNTTGTFQNTEVVFATVSVNYVTANSTDSPIVSFSCIGVSSDTYVTFAGWTVNANNYFIINGNNNTKIWDTNKYKIAPTGVAIGMDIQQSFFVVDNVQISVNCNGSEAGIGITASDVSANTIVRNCIIKTTTVSGTYNRGVRILSGNNNKIYNNIIYDFSGSLDYGINNSGSSTSTITKVYNNTIINCYNGIHSGSNPSLTVINNIVQISTNGYFGLDVSSCNISNIASDLSGYGDKNSTSVTFANESIFDFHLASNDTSAINSGADLSSIFTTDIDGQTRSGWDIGADEYTLPSVVEVTTFSTVVNTNGSQDYSSLSLWEASINCNLTQGTTVYNHAGITGSLVNGVKMYGATSGATGTLVDATTNLILLTGTTGVFQSNEIVFATASVNYVALSNIGNSAIAYAVCVGTTADTTAVTINGFTTSVSNYVYIIGNNTSGIYNTNCYRNVIGGVFTITDSNIYIKNLQIYEQSTGAYNTINANTGESNINIINCILRSKSTNSGSKMYYGNSSINFISCIVYPDSSTVKGMECYGGMVQFNNCTIYGLNYGIWEEGGTVIATNTICNSNVDNYKGGVATSYCASDTASELSGTGDRDGTDGDVTFVNTTLGSEDFHLASNDVNAIGLGTDLSSIFTTDIDGETISGWCIGADWRAASAPAPSINLYQAIICGDQ